MKDFVLRRVVVKFLSVGRVLGDVGVGAGMGLSCFIGLFGDGEFLLFKGLFLGFIRRLLGFRIFSFERFERRKLSSVRVFEAIFGFDRDFRCRFLFNFNFLFFKVFEVFIGFLRRVRVWGFRSFFSVLKLGERYTF